MRMGRPKVALMLTRAHWGTGLTAPHRTDYPDSGGRLSRYGLGDRSPDRWTPRSSAGRSRRRGGNLEPLLRKESGVCG
jgi:hypothetical protein